MNSKIIQFFYPPQPTRIWPNSSLLPSFSSSRDWDAEIKYNGWRLLVFKLEQDKILLYNRHSTIIDIDWQQFVPVFKEVPIGSVFDGELLDRRTKDLKNIIVLWDTCFYNGSDLRLKPLKDRRHFLDQHFSTAPAKLQTDLGTKLSKLRPSKSTDLKKSSQAQVFKTKQFKTDFLDLYNTIDKRNDPIEEGLVLKNNLSPYKYAARAGVEITDWLKVKKVDDSVRVSKTIPNVPTFT